MMKRFALCCFLSLVLAGTARAVPAGPPAGSPILNSSFYQRGAILNIDTATIRSINISTFSTIPSLPLGIKIGGATYNSSSSSDSRLYSMVDPRDYGAVGNGVTDDWLAIQTAINNAGSRPIHLASGKYFLSQPLDINRDGVVIIGDGVNSNSGATTSGSQLITNGCDVIQLGDGTHSLLFNVTIEGVRLTLNGAGNGITLYDSAIWINLRHVWVELGNVTGAGLALKGFVQQWYVEDFNAVGGLYGILHAGGVGDAGGAALFDKNLFQFINCNGQAQNSIKIAVNNANNNTFQRVVCNFSSKSGFILDGGTFWNLIDLNFEHEASGQGQVRTTALTVSSTTGICVVSSTVGFSVGNTVTLERAGTNHLDETTTISAMAGSSITLTALPAFHLTNVNLTNARYNDLELGPNNNTTFVTVVDGAFTEETADRILYGVYVNAGSGHTFVGCSGQDIGGPGGTSAVTVIGGNIKQRVEGAALFGNTAAFTAPLQGANSIIPSPTGGDVNVFMKDSNGDTSGSFGSFRVRRYDSSRNDVIEFPGDLSYGYIASSKILFNAAATTILAGSGSPEGGVAANVGSIYLRTNGGSSTTLYVKETGTGVTGWVGK